jgi:hypothetical protein
LFQRVTVCHFTGVRDNVPEFVPDRLQIRLDCSTEFLNCGLFWLRTDVAVPFEIINSLGSCEPDAESENPRLHGS